MNKPMMLDSVVEVVEMTNSELETAEAVISRGLNTFVEVGQALLRIRDGQGYRLAGHGTFEGYCRDKWGMVRRTADRLIQAAEVVDILRPTGLVLPTAERHVRPLTSADLNLEQQREAWTGALELAQSDNGGKVTAAIVQTAVEKVTGQYKHVSDDSYEWYTPAEYIEAARNTMGGIDLDPASCDEANKVVKAEAYLTKNEDGLNQKWTGRVWLNPPYCMPEIELFTGRAIELFETGAIEQAVILVNNATDTTWFHRLLQACPAVCFTRGRVKFYGPDGSASAGARQGQAVFYLGQRVKMFIREYERFGAALRKFDD